MEEFDPQPPQKAVRTIQDYQQEILEVFEEKQMKRHEQVFYRTSWVIENFLRGWQMDISEGNPSGVDVMLLCKKCAHRYAKKLREEILALNDIKFQLALKVQRQKESPDATEEFTELVLRHKHKALLQVSEIKQTLNKAIPHLLKRLEK